MALLSTDRRISLPWSEAQVEKVGAFVEGGRVIKKPHYIGEGDRNAASRCKILFDVVAREGEDISKLKKDMEATGLELN